MTIKLNAVIDDEVKDFNRELFKLNSELQEVLKIEDFPRPTKPDDFSYCNFKLYVDEMILKVEDTTILDSQTKKAIISRWQNALKVASYALKCYDNFVKRWSKAVLVFNSETNKIECKDFSFIEKKYTYEVPEEAVQHLQIIHSVYDAISNLRQWEQAHNVQKRSLQKLVQMEETKLYELWVTGAIHPQKQDNVNGMAKAYHQAINDIMI